MTIERRYALARPYRLSLDSYAHLTGVHPDLVRRLTALGLLEMTRDTQGACGLSRHRLRQWPESNGSTEN
jgi:chaperone modulatory protein CbpM